MTSNFERDAYPDRPRILFVGLGESSHTHEWIDLLAGQPFNVRLFSMPSGVPPDTWPTKTYVTAYDRRPSNSSARLCLFDKGKTGRFVSRNWARLRRRPWNASNLISEWLAEIIERWRPHVIHTMGLDQGEFYFRTRKDRRLKSSAKWVLQTRGGSDLALSH